MKNKLPVVIIILGVLATIFFFISKNKLEEELSAAESVKGVSDKQVEIYRDIDSHYGKASNEFYANKPVIVLSATEVIRIYWEKNSGLNAARNTDALETKWGEIDGKWIPYTITSRVAKGYETVDFTNKENDETFSVLVIIK